MKIELLHIHSVFNDALKSFIQKHEILFNSQSWLQIYDDKQIHQAILLNNNNEIIGCFIYYTFKKAAFKFLITPPYAPHIDLFFINPAESIVGKNTFEKEVSDTLATYFSQLKFDYLNLNLPLNFVDTQPFIWSQFLSRNRFTYLINLKESEETLWNNLSTEKRKSVKKAEKDELKIEETKDYQLILPLVLKSLSRNERAKNTHIIQNILLNFANVQNSFAYIAKNASGYLGATFCIIYQSKAIYLFGGFDTENKHHGAHVSCMWQSILHAKKLGLELFDFEGSMNKSIERYFREFGGEMKAYSCIEKIKPGLHVLLKLKGNMPV